MSDKQVPSDEQVSSDKQVPLRHKLNLETARAPWRELQTFFASGMVLYVRSDLDLLLAGEQFAADNAPIFQEWLAEGKVAQVSDEQALKWFEDDLDVWTLVIKPWILVQETEA